MRLTKQHPTREEIDSLALWAAPKCMAMRLIALVEELSWGLNDTQRQMAGFGTDDPARAHAAQELARSLLPPEDSDAG